VPSGLTASPPVCKLGVTGSLDGVAINDSASQGGSLISNVASFSVGSYTLTFTARLAAGSDTLPDTDFTNGLLTVERTNAFDIYCVGAGHWSGAGLATLNQLSRLTSCSAMAQGANPLQICYQALP
jgi:hypothetical protein